MGLKILVGATELGLIFGITALGVYITYRVLDFPDLTADGSITAGAAVAAVFIQRGGSPWVGFALSILVGALAGLVTGLLHTGLGIPPLLSGILTMTGLYSVNLRIMGRANVPLLGEPTMVLVLSKIQAGYRWLCLGLVLSVLVIRSLHRFFETELGLALRASGDNEAMAQNQGIDTDRMKVLGLCLGNALIACSGAAIAQLQGFADMGMGTGTLVAGLAAVIIGEAMVKPHPLSRAMTGVVLGSLVYRTLISLALRLGLRTTDLKLITAVMVVLALSLPGLGLSNGLRIGRQPCATDKEG